MEHLYIYFDEFGHFSPNNDKPSAFSHFIYTALIFHSLEEKDAFEEKASEIINQKYSGNFFKANKLASHSKLEILNALIEFKWRLSVLVVDQRKLFGALNEYQKSFIKYFQRVFLKEITEAYDSYNIYFDKTGSPEFQNSLKDYINKKLQPWDLFSQGNRTYTMHDERIDKNIMLCFTDIFANSFGQYFCSSHFKAESKPFLENVLSRVQVTHFPYKEIYNNELNESTASTTDVAIRELTYTLAVLTLKELHEKDEKRDCQALLEHMLLAFKLNKDRLLPLQELIDYLQNFYPGITEDRTRAIISDLRNQKVLIISSKGRAGYKLASSLADFDMFFKRYLDSIIPMIRRIEQYNDVVYEKSQASINLIGTVSNPTLLKDLISVIKLRT